MANVAANKNVRRPTALCRVRFPQAISLSVTLNESLMFIQTKMVSVDPRSDHREVSANQLFFPSEGKKPTPIRTSVPLIWLIFDDFSRIQKRKRPQVVLLAWLTTMLWGTERKRFRCNAPMTNRVTVVRFYLSPRLFTKKKTVNLMYRYHIAYTKAERCVYFDININWCNGWFKGRTQRYVKSILYRYIFFNSHQLL